MAESHREEIARLEDLYASNPGGRVFVHLAEAYRKAGEHEHARRILAEGLERHADSASGYVVLGRVLADLGEDGEAEAAFGRVLQLDGGNLIALRWLGDLAHRSGRFDEAGARYRELLSRNPSDDGIRELLEATESAARTAAPAGPASTQPAAAGLPDVEPATGDAPDWNEAGATFDDEPHAAGEPGDTITPPIGAPGFTDADEPREVEYGVVELEALPGDLASFAGIEDEGDEYDEADAFELELNAWTQEDETGVVGAFEAEAETSQFEPLPGHDDGDDAEALDIHVLDAALAPDPDAAPADEDAAPADELADLVDGGPEYAFVAGSEDEDDEADELAHAIAFAEGIDTGDGAAAGDDEGLTAAADARPDQTLPDEAASDAGRPDEQADMPAADAADIVDDAVGASAAGNEEIIVFEAGLPAATDVDAAPVGGLEIGGYGAALGGLPTQEPDDAEDGLHTETIAELYSSQGFHERAADVYRSLLRQRPGDERLIARLHEAEAAMRPPQPVEGLVEEDAAGEAWLQEAGTAWTGDAPADVATPYTWTEAGDEAASAPPIRAWLQDLVAWRPTHTSTADAAGGHDAESDYAGAADPAGAASTGAAAVDAGAEPEMLLDDATPLPGAGEGLSAGQSASTGTGWTPDELAEPWSTTPAPEPGAGAAPGPTGTDATPQAEPVAGDLDRWATPATAPAAEPAEPLPPAAQAEVPPPAAQRPVRRNTDPVEDAFLEWFGDAPEGSTVGAAPGTEAPQPAPPAVFGEVPPAVPAVPTPAEAPPSPAFPGSPASTTAEPPVPPVSAAPTAAPAASPESAPTKIRLDEGPTGEADAAEDEDLEMFRSWLQGLKK